MKILDKKKYLIDLLIDCEENMFKDPELYYYRLRMREFIEKIDFNKNIVLYHQNEFIHALRMKNFTNYGWRNKIYVKYQLKNDLRKKQEKKLVKKDLQLTINFDF